MKNIIFIAPPAAGKGTQSSLLQEHFGYNHISTGDILRNAVNSDSEIGLSVKKIMESGSLITDEIMIHLLEDTLKFTGRPFIIDGFPRTISQAKALDNMSIGEYIVVYLHLDEEEALKRVLNRLTCSCGESYNLLISSLQPKREGICDKCGSLLNKRNDDNIESFQKRYKKFTENIIPIINYYKEKNNLYKIDVNKSVKEIFQNISEVIKL